MEKNLAEEAYLKLDIVTGRLYRCMTSLLQDFLEIQFSSFFGESWMEALLKIADSAAASKSVNYSAKVMLRQLIEKRDNYGTEVITKRSLDISAIHTISLYICFYITCVPKFILPRDKMLNIVGTGQKFLPDDELISFLDETVRRKPETVLLCQKEMTYKINGVKYDLTEGLSFTNHVKRFADDKNRLNSHMSDVTNPLIEDSLVSETIRDVRFFLDFLGDKWEYSGKQEFIRRFEEQLETIEYLNFCDEFREINDAFERIVKKKDAAAPKVKAETFRHALRLLSNRENHVSTGKILEEDIRTNPNTCSFILLAFMRKMDWIDTRSSNEYLVRAKLLYPEEKWIEEAKKNRQMDREKALVYYIGHSLADGNIDGYYYASYIAVRLENFEMTKALFRLSGAMNENQKKLAESFASIRNETDFIKCAKMLNNRH